MNSCLGQGEGTTSAKRLAGRRILAAGLAVGLLGCVLLLAGCGGSGEDAQQVSDEKDPLLATEQLFDVPGERFVAQDLAYSEDADRLFALTDSGFEPDLQSDISPGAVAWFSDDHGATWEPYAEAPEGLPLSCGGVLGPDGSYVALFAASDEELERTNGAARVAVYRDAQGNERVLEGMAEYMEGVMVVITGFVSPDAFTFCVLSRDLMGPNGEGEEDYLYSISEDRAIAQLDSTEYVSIGSSCPFDGESFLVFGSGGVGFFSLDGSAVEVPPAFAEMLGADLWSQESGTLRALDFMQSDGGIVVLAEDKALSYDIASGQTETLMTFDSTMFEGTFPNGASSAVDKDGGIYLSFYSQAKQGYYLCRVSRDASSDEDADKEKLVIYTLEQNRILSQAVSRYQQEHPELSIELQVGMEESSATTKQDAVRALNARILGGDSPDLILLDGLPVDALKEKGCLADVSGLVDEDELFPGIMEALEGEDGHLPFMPMRFQVYAMADDAALLADVPDADAAMARLLERAKEGGVIEYMNADLGSGGKENTFSGYVQCLYNMEDPAIGASGGFDREGLRVFFGDMGALRDAMGSDALDMDLLYADSGPALGYVISGLHGCELDSVDLLYGFAALEQERREVGSAWELVPTGNACFRATGCVGISSRAQNPAAAQDMFRYLFDEEVQELFGSSAEDNGLPVNRAACGAELLGETLRDEHAGNDPNILTEIMVERDGVMEPVHLYKTSQEEVDACLEQLDHLGYAFVDDAVVREAVMESLQKYLTGELSLDDAVDEAGKTIELYLAE